MRIARYFAAILIFCTVVVFTARAEPVESTLAIQGVSVFDPEAGKLIPDRTIIVRGEQIVSVGASSDEVPAGATRIDGRGRFAIPGLIDAHVHLVHVLDLAGVSGETVLPLYLAAGVTSVRSAGDATIAATRVAKFAEAHPGISPRVFLCSPLLDRDPPVHPGSARAITDPAQVPAVLDDVQKSGATTVKIYAGTGRTVGKTIIEEAHRRKLFVTAHLGAYSAQDAIADGVDGLEHIWSVFNNIIPPEDVGKPGHRGRVDLSNPLCTSLIEELAKRKTLVDPTLVVFRNMILLPDVPSIANDPANELVPDRLRQFWPVYLRQTGCPQGGPLEDRTREFTKYQELVGKLHAAGVPLLVGTDSPEPQVTPGFSLLQELELLFASGLTPAEVLKAATLNNATALRQQDHIGSIAPGKLADIVLLSADPLEDIANVRKIESVIRGGIVCKPADVLKQMQK